MRYDVTIEVSRLVLVNRNLDRWERQVVRTFTRAVYGRKGLAPEVVTLTALDGLDVTFEPATTEYRASLLA